MPRPGTPLIPAGALDAGREVSAGGMYDRCVIERDEPPGAFDPDTGLHDPAGGWTEVAQPDGVNDADGLTPCRIHPVPLNEDRAQVADDAFILSRYYARLPLNVTIRMDDRIRVVSVHAVYGDPRQQDRVYRAVDPTARSFATEARITVKEEVDDG